MNPYREEAELEEEGEPGAIRFYVRCKDCMYHRNNDLGQIRVGLYSNHLCVGPPAKPILDPVRGPTVEPAMCSQANANNDCPHFEPKLAFGLTRKTAGGAGFLLFWAVKLALLLLLVIWLVK